MDSTGAPIGSSAWSRFTVDQLAPTVRSTRPGAVLVKRTATFKVTFSEPVTGATRKTVYLTRAGARKKLAATVVPNSDGTRVKLNPARQPQEGSVGTTSRSVGRQSATTPATRWSPT